MFVSSPLEALITDTRGRAAKIPSSSGTPRRSCCNRGTALPHDDHLHLRTACMPDEASSGCEGGGPVLALASASAHRRPARDRRRSGRRALLAHRIEAQEKAKAQPVRQAPAADEGASGLAPPTRQRKAPARRPDDACASHGRARRTRLFHGDALDVCRSRARREPRRSISSTSTPRSTSGAPSPRAPSAAKRADARPRRAALALRRRVGRARRISLHAAAAPRGDPRSA